MHMPKAQLKRARIKGQICMRCRRPLLNSAVAAVVPLPSRDGSTTLGCRAFYSRLQPHERDVQLRFGVVEMRAEAEVALALPIVAQGRDDAGLLQLREQVGRWNARVEECRNSARVGSGNGADELHA